MAAENNKRLSSYFFRLGSYFNTTGDRSVPDFESTASTQNHQFEILLLVTATVLTSLLITLLKIIRKLLTHRHVGDEQEEDYDNYRPRGDGFDIEYSTDATRQFTNDGPVDCDHESHHIEPTQHGRTDEEDARPDGGNGRANAAVGSARNGRGRRGRGKRARSAWW